MSEQIEHEGVSYVYSTVTKALGWIWRPTGSRDHGVDGTIEVAEIFKGNTVALSRLIQVQIKSGKSYFPNNKPGKAVIRLADRSCRYHSDSSLPVIFIAYSPEMEVAYWIEFGKGLKTTINGEKQIEIPLTEDYLFNENAKATLNLLSIRPYQFARTNHSFLESLSDIFSDKTLSTARNDTVVDLLLSTEMNQLIMSGLNKPSLLAIDTSIEDFKIDVWEQDQSFKKHLKKLLELKRKCEGDFNYTQIFSISTPVGYEVWQALVFQIELLKNNSIKVGVVNRSSLSQDINRDFSIINNDLVMKYNTKTWSNCHPLPGQSPIKLYNEIFTEISSQTFWCNRPNWKTGLAKFLGIAIIT